MFKKILIGVILLTLIAGAAYAVLASKKTGEIEVAPTAEPTTPSDDGPYYFGRKNAETGARSA